jgi:hypothetical protein
MQCFGSGSGFNQVCIIFSAVNFFQFLVIKAQDSDWIRIGIQPKMLDPDPGQMNMDPEHWPHGTLPACIAQAWVHSWAVSDEELGKTLMNEGCLV